MPHPPDPITTRFHEFVSRVVGSGVAAPSDLVGCSDDEIDRLERKYGISLPASYRLFLQTMGHQSGRLFAHDHVSQDYADVLGMTEEQVQFWNDITEAERVVLPADVLVIQSRMGEQWLCIRCAGGDDAPVLYYSEGGGAMRESFPSVLDWLEMWRSEAQEAIASGYYERFPRGAG